MQGRSAAVVSIESGQVAIASENVFIQYDRYVSMRLLAIVIVRGSTLWPLVFANGSHRRRAGSARPKRNRGV
jgi:hypothetical protein